MPIQLATYDLSRRRLFEVVEDWTAFESNLLVAHVSEGFITWSSIAKHMLTQSWHKTQQTRIGTFPVFSAGVNPRSGSSQPTCSCQAPSQNSARSISGCPLRCMLCLYWRLQHLRLQCPRKEQARCMPYSFNFHNLTKNCRMFLEEIKNV